MEIYKDSSNRKVYLDVPLTPVTGSVSVLVLDNNDNQVAEILSMTEEVPGQKYSVNLPFSVIDNHSFLNVRFAFDYTETGATYSFSRDIPVEIVTPFLSVAEVKSVLGNMTDEAALEAEKAVRLIIYAHTGQKFDKTKTTYKIRGNGRGYIDLPNRLISLTNFNNFTKLPYGYYLGAGGWSIRGGIRDVPNIKADYHGLYEINGRVYNEFGVLPEWFRENEYYVISGMWGWPEIPAEVKQAAKILLVDYNCDDAAYRDKYIDAISAVDWRVQFNAGAFERTGNVKADQLLSKYVLKRGWAVV